MNLMPSLCTTRLSSVGTPRSTPEVIRYQSGQWQNAVELLIYNLVEFVDLSSRLRWRIE